MLVDPIEAPEDRSVADVHQSFLEGLADVVESVGLETAAERTAIERDRLRVLLSREVPSFTLHEAAEILALTPEWSDGDAVRMEVRDHLMLGMSSAVLDVDALEREIDAALDAKEIQAKIEGRRSMTLREYADVVLTIARENDFA
ncbi:MAG: DUF5791 family protein [Halanaeroarchaeum sp.]